jgi:hypothetical protein
LKWSDDQAGNNEESNDNSWQDRASGLSVVSGFSFSSGKPRIRFGVNRSRQ